MSFKRKTIEQIIHKYALINGDTAEWLYEGTTYNECLRQVTKVVPEGAEYVIVAIMKEGKR